MRAVFRLHLKHSQTKRSNKIVPLEMKEWEGLS